MREFVRHPSDIPIKISSDKSGHRHFTMNNLSMGGLSCQVDHPVHLGSLIKIMIPVVKPVFEGHGVVVWCEARESFYDIGIQFTDAEQAFRSRMVEQICQIEHYRKQIAHSEGRWMSPEEAAVEWIERYAADFDPVDDAV